MTDRAIITSRGAGPAAPLDDTGLSGVTVTGETVGGTLVEGARGDIDALEGQGFRVKVLRDTNLLRIGDHEIDIDGPPASSSPAAADAEPDGPPDLHLVQLVAPPTDEWVQAVEARGVDVVEPVSSYGLVVVGSPAQVGALTGLPFVAWTGALLPEYRIAPSVRAGTGETTVSVTVYPAAAAPDVEALVAARGGGVVRGSEVPATYGGTYAVLLVDIDAAAVPDLAADPHVRWIEHRPPYAALGERETQILAENLDGKPVPNTGPVPGYQAWLTAVGLDGTGVTVAVADTGVDANAANNAIGHTDLRGRQVALVAYPNGVSTDTSGHGTHVAGIAVGSGATGQTEAASPEDFLWGQGAAPAAGYVTQAFLLTSPQPGTATLITDAAANAADVMNNSWGFNDSPGSGYTAGSRTIDLGVRDPNPNAAGLEHLVIVCSAGNDGGSDRSISGPHETKNDIVVGNSLTSRPGGRFPGDDIRGISPSSSRGPAVDGRILPTVVAPGTDVSSALSRTAPQAQAIAGTGTPDPTDPAALVDRYVFLSGTSMAAPAVSGAAALLTQWWRQTRSGAEPSPALVKALLVNGAEDLAGGQNWRGLNRTTLDRATWSATPGAGSVFGRVLGHVPTRILEGEVELTAVASLAAITAPGRWFFDPATGRLHVRTSGGTNPGAGGRTVASLDSAPLPPIPNGHQGWGRVSLENVLLQAPASDRGPRIITDQRHAFTAGGQEHLVRVAPVDPARALRVTLAWTDAAGAAGSVPALVNDLDLEVTELATGTVFKGNVFAGGFSVAGGAFDDRNNVECVYVRAPAGTYEVRVLAASIPASARPDLLTPWQDFALVIDNAEVPSAPPVSVVPVLDRSGSMVAYDYVDTTRTASEQFLGLLGLGDQVGVVSFGDTATTEFSDAGGLATITGEPVRSAAGAAVDAIAFGGCTFMGAGIVTARNLLAGGVGNRAMVLFSDGYDNKGCDVANPAKPSAAAAAATLPAGTALHTCAMGPAADQALLSGLATGGGRYYYVPAIDDLFEVYNYVRGQVSGDAVAVVTATPASATPASATGVGITVDALATAATFTVAWTDRDLRAVWDEPREPGEVAIRLRGPHGRLLHPDAGQVHRTAGAGFVVFRLDDPAPGRWQVETRVVEGTALHATVAGFTTSPLRLVTAVVPPGGRPGSRLAVGGAVLLDGRPIGPVRMSARIVGPAASLDRVLTRFRDDLADLQPPRDLDGDGVPPDIAKMATLRRTLRAAGKPDPFGTVGTDLALRSVSSTRLAALGLAGLLPGAPAGRTSGALAGVFDATAEAGTYNVVVTASGVEPGSGARFTRQELVSVLLG